MNYYDVVVEIIRRLILAFWWILGFATRLSPTLSYYNKTNKTRKGYKTYKTRVIGRMDEFIVENIVTLRR
jgi:hypothetical protein